MMIFRLIWITWCASEILLNRLMRSSSNDKKGKDKGSLRFIWIMIVLAISFGFIFANHVKVPISNQSLISYAGLVIIIVGMVIIFLSIWTLGKYFTVDVTIRDNHKIKKDGFYSIIRHPSYSGSLLSFIGFGISLNNWLSLITVVILIMISFLYRIKIEEKILIEQFGNEYLDYRENTYRLIPLIY